MREALQSAIDHLQLALEHVDAATEAEGKAADAEARLEAATTEHAAVTKLLDDDRTHLDRARAEAASRHDAEMLAKTKELRELTDAVAAKRTELADTTARVTAARTDHDQVLASMDSLRKRLS